MKRWVLSLVLGYSLSGWTATAFAQTENLQQTLRRGEAELDSGQYEDAKATLKGVLAKEPKNTTALVLLGRTHTLLGEYQDALKALGEAEAAGADVKGDLGAVYYHSGDNAKALELLGPAAKAQPKNEDIRYLHGLALYKAKQHKDARTEFEAARELSPEIEAETLVFSAASAIKLGEWKTAEKELKQAVAAAEPGSATEKAAKESLRSVQAANKSFDFSSWLNYQFDTNVLLVPESGALFTPEEISNKAGARGVFVLDGAWRPRLGGDWRGLARYGLYQSAHFTNADVLGEFDVTNHSFSLGADRVSQVSNLSLPYTVSISYLDTFTDFDHYSTTNVFSPTYIRQFGNQSVGITYSVGYENFSSDQPALTLDGESIEQTRDNLFNQLTGTYRLGFLKGMGYLAPSLGVLYANAKGQSSWDNFGGRAALTAGLPLGAGFAVSAGGAFVTRSYANPFPVDSGAEDRSDQELSGNAALTFGKGAFQALGSVNYTRNDSTVDIFTYNRLIYTLGLGAQF
jgi:tetratricopeptide (TPR) repeat protein